MKIVYGSIPWILATFIAGILFLILTLITNLSTPRIIFLFLSILIFLKTGFLILFFRDPERNIGKGIVASADGRIREISNIKDKEIGDCTKISTFMNLYNVHFNRIPLDGTIKNVVHKRGLHIPAFVKESEKNEQVITIIDTNIGTIKVIQIAGSITRRIVTYIKIGDKIKKGERIGMIRFGSRVDVYLPTGKINKIQVKIGDKVNAGETTIAEING